mmetsp:Transcript_14261/g.34633  ORF Transcript_14261/g.34633 Transcript_14261/m.34633 type:complete len:134 (-) Transcript_14261:1012-1413(-)
MDADHSSDSSSHDSVMETFEEAIMEDQEEEDEIYHAVATAALEEQNKADSARRPKFRYNRTDWGIYFEQLYQTDNFQDRHHMSVNAFNKLVELLSPFIMLDETKSKKLYEREWSNPPTNSCGSRNSISRWRET